MVDHPDQVLSLERASVAAGAGASAASAANPWSVFIKIESGGKRAGLAPSSPLLVKLLETIVSSCPHVSVHGFYVHAGQSYASRSASEADSFLSTEVRSVNDAARLAKPILASSLDRHSQPFVLSVGSTPTAHAANLASSASTLNRLGAELEGALELHAGNYPFLDLQQLATGAVPVQSGMPAVAFSVLSTVIAEYPSRGTSSEAQAGEWAPDGLARSGDEGMCDAGGLAMSKDGGPWGGFGHVFWPAEKVGWELGRVSQEHGVLSVRAGAVKEWGLQWTNVDGKLGPVSQQGKPDRVRLGEKLRIVPQQ